SMPYLAYGLVEAGRKAICPEEKFHLSVTCAEEDWPVLRRIIRTWTLFGGLGARQHRGLGSIHWGRWPKFALNESDPQADVVGYLTRVSPGTFGAVFDSEIAPGKQGPAFPVMKSPFISIKHAGPFLCASDALFAIKAQLRRDTGPQPPQYLGPNGYGWRQGDGPAH